MPHLFLFKACLFSTFFLSAQWLFLGPGEPGAPESPPSPPPLCTAWDRSWCCWSHLGTPRGTSRWKTPGQFNPRVLSAMTTIHCWLYKPYIIYIYIQYIYRYIHYIYIYNMYIYIQYIIIYIYNIYIYRYVYTQLSGWHQQQTWQSIPISPCKKIHARPYWALKSPNVS